MFRRVVGLLALVALMSGTLTVSLGAGAAGTSANSGGPSSATADGQEGSGGTSSSSVASLSRGPGGQITCNWNYDYPHPGEKSGKLRVNAHLKIRCSGGMAGSTFVRVKSTMHSRSRVGSPSTDSGFGRARTGGDLRCTKKKQTYRALGRVYINYPPRYVPSTATASPRSVTRVFRQNRHGECVRP